MIDYKQKYLDYLNSCIEDNGKFSNLTFLIINAVESNKLYILYETINEIKRLQIINPNILDVKCNAVYYDKLRRYVRDHKLSKIN